MRNKANCGQPQVKISPLLEGLYEKNRPIAGAQKQSQTNPIEGGTPSARADGPRDCGKELCETKPIARQSPGVPSTVEGSNMNGFYETKPIAGLWLGIRNGMNYPGMTWG